MGKKKKKKKKSLPSMSCLTSPSVVQIIMEARERKKKEKEVAIKRKTPEEFTWEQICRFASGVKFKDNKENLKPSPIASPHYIGSSTMPSQSPSFYERWYALVTSEKE